MYLLICASCVCVFVCVLGHYIKIIPSSFNSQRERERERERVYTGKIFAKLLRCGGKARERERERERENEHMDVACHGH